MNMKLIVIYKDGTKKTYKEISEIYESEKRKELLLETIEYEYKIIRNSDIKEIKINV